MAQLPNVVLFANLRPLERRRSKTVAEQAKLALQADRFGEGLVDLPTNLP